MIKRSLRGFTIVELLIVIVVISILATISIFSYMQVQRQTNDNLRSNDISQLKDGLEKFYQSHGEYPPSCAGASCSSYLFTTNLSNGGTVWGTSATSTTSANLQAVLPNIRINMNDPAFSDNYPLYNISTTAQKYIYYGGGVDYKTTSSNTSLPSNATFPCTITMSLTPGQSSSYILGYYSQVSQQWVLTAGVHGTALTVTPTSNPNCTVN